MKAANQPGPVHNEEQQAHPILFFDGECGLCNRFVDLLLKTDNQDLYRFAPLQGETASNKLGRQDSAPRSFLLLDQKKLLEQSDAVMLVLRRLGGVWRLIGLLYVFPKPVRDLVYRFVARNRYRWFGKREICRLPTPEERDRFLP